MQIKPLFDRVVIEPIDAEEKTKSGIVLLAKDQEKPQMAAVVAVGPGGFVDGKEVKWKSKSATECCAQSMPAANSRLTVRKSPFCVRAIFWR